MKRIFKVTSLVLLLMTVVPSIVLAQQSPERSHDNSLSINVKGVSFKMICVQGGTFTMGCTPNKKKKSQNYGVSQGQTSISELSRDCWDCDTPAHKVTLSTYYIGETEVTQELWTTVMGSNPSYDKGDKFPVENVSWEDCQTFIRKLNELTGKKFRLPTEAEWEFAARGGTRSAGYKYSGSNNIKAVAWYDKHITALDKIDAGYEKKALKLIKDLEGDEAVELHVVKTKKPNELGIYDMSGNVWEWCSDWWEKNYYSDSAQSDPQGPSTGSLRVIRGGGCSSPYWMCCSTFRFLGGNPDRSLGDSGFRLVLDF